MEITFKNAKLFRFQGVNLTSILSKIESTWSVDLLTEILETCNRALTLYSNDLRQANECISSLLNLKRNSLNLIGFLYSTLKYCSIVGLFNPQTCTIRRSILIVGQRGLRKYNVLKCIWQLGPDVFYIPSSMLISSYYPYFNLISIMGAICILFSCFWNGWLLWGACYWGELATGSRRA